MKPENTAHKRDNLGNGGVPLLFVLAQTEGGVVVALGYEQALEVGEAVQKALVVSV